MIESVEKKYSDFPSYLTGKPVVSGNAKDISVPYIEQDDTENET
ncbi:hypothetical protein [Paenibacillus ihuae]|nr:hypothetical protein [Paenibacillus ihuae]